MSNEFAVAAVTLTLRNLLDKIKDMPNSDEFNQLPADAKPTAEILVTNLPLDEAYEFDAAKNQVNLFLYHIEHSAAWRNMDPPGRIKQGESGHPLLALNLYYVITAYGENGSELIGHLLLGLAHGRGQQRDVPGVDVGLQYPGRVVRAVVVGIDGFDRDVLFARQHQVVGVDVGIVALDPDRVAVFRGIPRVLD